MKTLGQGVTYGMGKNGLHFLFQEHISYYTKVLMKLKTKGEFSSKLRIECLVESGREACTLRPSPFSSINNSYNFLASTTHMRGDKVVTREAYWKVCLDKSKYSLNKST